MSFRILLLIASAAFLSLSCGQSPTTTTPESDGYELLSASLFKGPIYSVDVSGSYAFCGGDGSLHVLDISDRQDPTLVGGLPLYGRVYDIKIKGNYAYLAVDFSDRESIGSLLTVDISNPHRPNIVTRLEIMGVINHLTFHGDYIFGQVSVIGGICIFYLGNPANPQLVRTFRDTAFYNRLFSIATYGNYAFVAGQRRNLIMDITDPAHPAIVDSAMAEPSRFFVNEHYLYRLDCDDNITVFDIINPPHLDSIATITGSFGDIVFAGDYAYLPKNPPNSLEATIIDISNPANPAVVGTYNASVDIYSLIAFEDFLFHLENAFSLSRAGLRIVDISSHTDPIPMGYYLPSGGTLHLAVKQDYAYVISDGHFNVVDISVGNNPEVVESSLDGGGYDIDIQGNYAYIAHRHPGGLGIYDISIAGGSRCVSVFFVSYYSVGISGVHVDGNRAYYAANMNGLYVIDITNPASPIELAHWQFEECQACVDVYASGDYCYVLNPASDLIVLNVADPANIAEVGSYSSTMPLSNIIVEGNLAYVSGQSGFIILDITDPVHPIFKGQSNISDHSVRSLTISRMTIYASLGPNGIKIFDVGHDGNLTLQETIDTPNYAWSTAVTDRHIIVADGSSLLIYRKGQIF